MNLLYKTHSPYGIRTRVTAVRGRCLNPLTNGPLVLSRLCDTFLAKSSGNIR